MSILRSTFRTIKPTRKTSKPVTPFGVGLLEGYRILATVPVQGNPNRVVIITETPDFPMDSYRYAVRMFQAGKEIEASGHDLIAAAWTYARCVTTPLPSLGDLRDLLADEDDDQLEDAMKRSRRPTIEDRQWWAEQCEELVGA